MILREQYPSTSLLQHANNMLHHATEDIPEAIDHVLTNVAPHPKAICTFRAKMIKDEELRKKIKNFKLSSNQLLNAPQKALLMEIFDGISRGINCVVVNVSEGVLRLFQDALDPKRKRTDLSSQSWKGLDVINSKEVRKHAKNLHTLFSEKYLDQAAKECRESFNLKEALIAESLALQYVYAEGCDGTEIKIPVIQTDGSSLLVRYHVKQVNLGDSLPAYLLEPKEGETGPNWFVIRGTQRYTKRDGDKEVRTGAWESITADFIDPSGISMDVINKSVAEGGALRTLLLDYKKQGKKLTLAGHSLGGALATYIATQFFGQVEKSYSFSAPGISEEGHQYYKAVKKVYGVKPKLVNFLYDQDPIPLGGRWQIGNKFRIIPQKAITGGMGKVHTQSHLNRSFTIERVHSKKENHKFARTLCEACRRIVSVIMRLMCHLFYRDSIPDWYKNRSIYRAKRQEFDKVYNSPSELIRTA